MKIDKNFRITLPKRSFESFPVDGFVKAIIRNGDLESYFYLRVPSKCPSRKYLQVRRRIPDQTIAELHLQPFDDVKLIGIQKVEKPKAPMFKDSYFDLLSPNLPSMMVDAFLKNNEEWCRFWSSSKAGGITRAIELKRYIPINRRIGEFLGLMQAESRKSGDSFDFTNIFISEHKLFIDVAEELGISRGAWSFGLICNPKISLENIENAAENFRKETGLTHSKFYYARSKTLLNIAYIISVKRKLLNIVLNKILISLRKEVININLPEAKEFCKGFIIKYLLGDGTATVKKDLTCMDVVLSEKDIVSQKDFMEMLKMFGIKSNANGIKVDISTDFNACMWLLENDVFIGHGRNREKFSRYLKHNYFIKTKFDRFSSLDGFCTSKEFAEKNNLKDSAAKMYLFRNSKRGFLETFQISNKETSYKLTNKGKHFLQIIKDKLIP